MRNLALAWLRLPFWQRVVSGFVLGAVLGRLLGPSASTWLAPLGDLYVALIKMIAVPLVFFAVVNAIASLSGQRSIAALSVRTFIWFVITALFAVAIGLAVGTLMQPGTGHLHLMVGQHWASKPSPNPVHVLLDIVPTNVFFALAGLGMRTNAAGQAQLSANAGSILPVIFFAGLLGFALVKLGGRVNGFRQIMQQGSEVMNQITRFVMQVTPLGTLVLIGDLVGSYGFKTLLPFGKFIIALYIACLLQIFIVYSVLLIAHRLRPWSFFKGAAPAMQVAFVSSSSFASMPVALRVVNQNLGVQQDYAAFALPLAATIKMDGCGAIYPALCAVFIAQYMGIALTPNQYLIIALASVLGSFGTAGVPGTAVVMATVVLIAAGLPLEVIGYLYAIDRIVDMMRTMTNVTGQMLVPVLVAKEVGLLDQSVYSQNHTS